MNKKWMVLPLALLLVFGLAFFGCSTDADDDDGDDKKGGGGDDTVSLGATKITLTDNFEYGAGYQSVDIAWKSFFSSIKENDVYEFDIEFTVSRDLEYVLQWAIVDNSAAANYWKPLTKYVTVGGEVDGLEEGDPDKGAYTPVPPAGALVCTTAGGPYTWTEKVTVTADPVTLSSVVVAFTTKGAGIVGEGDSGTKGSVDISFTKFDVTKVTEGAGGGDDGDGDGKAPTENFVVASPSFYAIGGNSSQITVTGSNVNITADAQATSAGFAWNFPADLGNGFKVTDYKLVNVKFTIVETNGAGGASYNAKANTGMSVNVNVNGKTGDYDNELAVTPGTAGSTANADYPIAEFVNNLVAFQFNPWAGSVTGINAAVNITITVDFTLIP